MVPICAVLQLPVDYVNDDGDTVASPVSEAVKSITTLDVGCTPNLILKFAVVPNSDTDAVVVLRINDITSSSVTVVVIVLLSNPL